MASSAVDGVSLHRAAGRDRRCRRRGRQRSARAAGGDRRAAPGRRPARSSIGGDRLHAARSAHATRRRRARLRARRTGSGTGLAPGLTLDDNLVLKRFDRPPHLAPRRCCRRRRSRRPPHAPDRRLRRARRPRRACRSASCRAATCRRRSSPASSTEPPRRAPRRGAHPRARPRRRRERCATTCAVNATPGRGVLLFSEDLSEVLELSDVVLVMYQGRIVGSFDRDRGRRRRDRPAHDGSVGGVSVLPANPFVVAPRARPIGRRAAGRARCSPSLGRARASVPSSSCCSATTRSRRTGRCSTLEPAGLAAVHAHAHLRHAARSSPASPRRSRSG